MKFLILDILNLYKRFISPMFPPSCRFEPSCSSYAMEAVSKYGAIKGVWMGTKRLCRCQPLCRGGYDPVA